MCIVLKELAQAGLSERFLVAWTGGVRQIWFLYKSPGVAAWDIFCAMDLKSDEICLFKCPKELIQAVSVNGLWKVGGRNKRLWRWPQIEIERNPMGQEKGVAKESQVVCWWLRCFSMSPYAWSFYSSVSMDWYLDTLFFCAKPGQRIQHSTYSLMLAISIKKDDLIRVINASKSVVVCIRSAIEHGFSSQTQWTLVGVSNRSRKY